MGVRSLYGCIFLFFVCSTEVGLSQSNPHDSLKVVIKDLESRYAAEKIAKENEMLKMDLMMAASKAQKQRLIILFGTIISILGASITFILYRSRNNIKRKNILLSDQHKEICSQNKEIFSQAEQLRLKNKNLDQQNKKLEEVNCEKDSLISIVAHDLRAPLSRTKGLSTILQSTPLSEEQRGVLKLMTQINEEGLHLIKDILNANLETYECPEPTAINLNHFITDHIDRYFKDQARNKAIEIHTVIEEDLEIITDVLSLRRIIDNLISNALKFSFSDSIIFVRVLSVQEAVYISVQDQGPGISIEDQKKMFRKFQKLSARPTSGEASTGLGLAIVKGLVERMKGEITVKSELDKGTEFIIRLEKKLELRSAC